MKGKYDMTVKEIIELEKRNTQIFKILLRDADTKNKIGFFLHRGGSGPH